MGVRPVLSGFVSFYLPLETNGGQYCFLLYGWRIAVHNHKQYPDGDEDRVKLHVDFGGVQTNMDLHLMDFLE